jgi:hypothetical protein
MGLTDSAAAIGRLEADLSDGATAGDEHTDIDTCARIGADSGATFMIAGTGLAGGLALIHGRAQSIFTAHSAAAVSVFGTHLSSRTTERDDRAPHLSLQLLAATGAAPRVSAAELSGRDALGSRRRADVSLAYAGAALHPVGARIACDLAEPDVGAEALHAAEGAAVHRSRAAVSNSATSTAHAHTTSPAHVLASPGAALGGGETLLAHRETGPFRAETDPLLADPGAALIGSGALRGGGQTVDISIDVVYVSVIVDAGVIGRRGRGVIAAGGPQARGETNDATQEGETFEKHGTSFSTRTAESLPVWDFGTLEDAAVADDVPEEIGPAISQRCSFSDRVPVDRREHSSRPARLPE